MLYVVVSILIVVVVCLDYCCVYIVYKSKLIRDFAARLVPNLVYTQS